MSLDPVTDVDSPSKTGAAGIIPRFGATLVARAVGGCSGLAASILLARGLGASAFGDFNFLIATFTALNTFLDLGSSNAYYTFQSQDPGSRGNLRFFGLWLAARFALVAGFLAFLAPSSLIDKVWLGQGRGVVLLAFVAFFFSVPLNTFLVQTGESARRTVFVQSAQAVLSVLHFTVVLALYVSKLLSLPGIFLLLIAEYAAFMGYFWWRLGESGFHSGAKDAVSHEQLLRRYARYCSPLLFYCVLGYVCEFADRWLLQYFGGSTQQGFFSLSQQFASVVLLATVALMNIFWKEIAEAQHRGDRERVRRLYRRSARSLFFLAAAGAAFLMPHTRLLLRLAAGPGYESAWPALSLMLLYPVFQTLGQLNGVFFYATEDTKTHVSVSSVGMLAGLPLTYFLLASSSARVPGLGLGSVGLAARWSLLQMAVVGWQSRLVAKRQGVPSDVAHHFTTLAALLGLGWTVYAAAVAMAPRMGPFAWMGVPAICTILYWPAVAVFVFRFPDEAGIEHGHVSLIADRLRGLMK